MTREHELKCWPEFFGPVSGGEKTFELRRDDRDPPYATGDVLRLREWSPVDAAYTGRECRKRVTYTLGAAAHLGLALGHVIMGLADVDDAPDAPPERGANVLDTPEVRAALHAALERVARAHGDVPIDDFDEREAIREIVAAIIAALAQHVAAAQRAVYRAGVEAAAEVYEAPERRLATGNTLSGAIRGLPPPTVFAAPEPDSTYADGLRRGAKIARAMAPDTSEPEWRAAVADALDDAAMEMEREAVETAP